MSDRGKAPGRIHILTSDVEMLADIPEGTAESVVASRGPMHNMHGGPATIEYMRMDMFLGGELRGETLLKTALMSALAALDYVKDRGDLGMLRMECEKVVASLRDA